MNKIHQMLQKHGKTFVKLTKLRTIEPFLQLK